MSQLFFEVEKYIFVKKVEKSCWTVTSYCNIIDILDHFRYVKNNMALQNKGTCNEQFFRYTEIQSAQNCLQNNQYRCIFYL